MRLFISIACWVALFAAIPTPDAKALSDPPFLLPKQAELSRMRSAKLVTNRGTIWFELFPEDAPWHVANFKYLADKGFYKGLPFHIYMPGYILQGGAPSNKDPNSGPAYVIPAEFTQRGHEEGTLGMARIRGPTNPERNSHGSQFHILLGDAPSMNGSYTIFGKVKNGLSVLRDLRKGDRIVELTVFVRH